VAFSGGAACGGPARFRDAAEANRQSLSDLSWAPFGRPERGWEVYAPRLRQTLKAGCPADSPGFAARLAAWQGGRGLAPTGVMDAAAFEAIKTDWQAQRPFVRLRQTGACPDPPGDVDLTDLRPDDVVDGKTVQLRRDAARALHRMLAKARAQTPSAASGQFRLAAFSGYRSPAYDAARCASAGDCDGVGRAVCSAHRTGQAVDLVLGAAPGYAVDSSADANRLYQTRQPAYHWLIAHAHGFGFVNYAYEPWHWEWTGEAR
jgi:hypothetical protein